MNNSGEIKKLLEGLGYLLVEESTYRGARKDDPTVILSDGKGTLMKFQKLERVSNE